MIYQSDIGTKRWQKKICDALGEVVHTLDTLMHDGRSFIQIRVTIDVSLPLCRGHLISIDNGRQVWVSFKFERLPNICYWCGFLDHDDNDYDVWIASEGTLKTEQQQFGPSLRAPTFVQSRKFVMVVPRYYKSKLERQVRSSSSEPGGRQGPMESAMNFSPPVVPSNTRVGQPFDIQPIRNVALVLVTSTSMQSEQVESVPHKASQPVLLNEGCLDIDGQASKGDNFESQPRDIDKGLTKFDTPSTPQLVISLALDKVEAHLPLPRVPLDSGEISSTTVQPTKMST